MGTPCHVLLTVTTSPTAVLSARAASIAALTDSRSQTRKLPPESCARSLAANGSVIVPAIVRSSSRRMLAAMSCMAWESSVLASSSTIEADS
jgi:hypothetical protein